MIVAEGERRPAPPPPEWLIEHGIGTGRPAVRVHTGDCWDTRTRCKPATTDAARRALTEGIPAAPFHERRVGQVDVLRLLEPRRREEDSDVGWPVRHRDGRPVVAHPAPAVLIRWIHDQLRDHAPHAPPPSRPQHPAHHQPGDGPGRGYDVGARAPPASGRARLDLSPPTAARTSSSLGDQTRLHGRDFRHASNPDRTGQP
ncbi:DUF6233 domain-containing protein [Streptomyces sp. NPDC054904]